MKFFQTLTAHSLSLRVHNYCLSGKSNVSTFIHGVHRYKDHGQKDLECDSLQNTWTLLLGTYFLEVDLIIKFFYNAEITKSGLYDCGKLGLHPDQGIWPSFLARVGPRSLVWSLPVAQFGTNFRHKANLRT